MDIADIIIIFIVAAVVTGIGVYLYKAKKRGETCIGCPYAKQCSSKCNGNCSGKTINTKSDE